MVSAHRGMQFGDSWLLMGCTERLSMQIAGRGSRSPGSRPGLVDMTAASNASGSDMG